MSRLKALLATFGLIAAATATAPSQALAAQDALVTNKEAVIYESPDTSSETLETKAAGNRVRVSNQSKDGWFRARTSSGQLGWIQQADLTLLSDEPDARAAALELTEKSHDSRNKERRRPHHFYLRLGGMGMGLISPEVSYRMGHPETHIYPTFGLAGDLGYELNDTTRLVLRAMPYTSSSTVRDGYYTVEFSSLPVLLGAEFDFAHFAKFDVSLNFYGGWAFGNTLSVTAPKAPKPNSMSISGNYWAGLVDVGFRRPFSYRWAGILEVGYYYSRISPTLLRKPFNGDGPFRDDRTGELSKILVNQNGPLLTLSIQLTL